MATVHAKTRVTPEQLKVIERVSGGNVMAYLRDLIRRDMQQRKEDYPDDPKHGGNRR